MPLPSGSEPWFGLSPEMLRFLEIHPARAIAIPGRGWSDFVDAAMLFSAVEKDPFFNRLMAVRWPENAAEFDARLGMAVELFTALERKPYIWTMPGLSEPRDLVARLSANGFINQGGGYDMVLLRDPSEARDGSLPPGAVLERWSNPSPADRPALAEAIALIIGESFHIPASRHGNLIREISLTLEQPRFHACLVRIDGEPVATGERYTFDGASYISSVGTRPAWRGLGLARQITLALARDSLASGVDLVYLGVYADNLLAIRMYEKLGFRILGTRSSDMLQERPAVGTSGATSPDRGVR